MNNTLIAIDLAKHVFQVCVMNGRQKVLSNKKLKRALLLEYLRQFEPCTVVMEACYSSNSWGRAIQQLGHEVKLIPPHQVKPFVIGNKNDSNDAIAIAEAAHRPKARFVDVKTLHQQDIQTVHRIRERCIRQRTALINQLRGLLSEYGEIVPMTRQALRKQIPLILENGDNNLTVVMRNMVSRLVDQWQNADQEIAFLDQQLQHLIKQNEHYQNLNSIPGIGPLGTALIIASVGDAAQFKNGRQFAAWIGLTPKQYASGDTRRMGSISKRGNAMLRKTLIHGARTVLNWCDNKNDPLSLWLQKLKQTLHPCKLIVALANKIARIIWAVLHSRRPYDPKLAAQAVS